MKPLNHFIILICSLFVLNVQLSAQITITQSNQISLGDTVLRGADTLPAWLPGPGSAGANQTWDFANATQHIVENTRAIAPSSTPSASSFTSSNLALTVDNLNYLFFDYNSSNVIVDGFAGNPFGSGTLDVIFKS